MTRSRPYARWVRTAASEVRGLAGSLDALLAPGLCAACGADSIGPLCSTCLSECLPPDGPCCPRCGEAHARTGRRGCARCRRFGRGYAFDAAVALWAYRGAVRELVHAFKYRGHGSGLSVLGRRMACDPRLAATAQGSERALVVAVPARRASVRARGYDQARELASGFSCELRLPFEPRALRRRRAREPAQAGALWARRRRQVRGAFRLSLPAAQVRRRRVVLVDDVLSTGATADACSRRLIAAGAASVRVVTLAG